MTLKMKEEVCLRIAGGESLRVICADAHLVDRDTVHRELYRDEKFCGQYTHARKFWAISEFETMNEIADTPLMGVKHKTKINALNEEETEELTGDMIDHRRLQVQTRQWSLARMNQNFFGDKQKIEMNVADIESDPDAIAAKLDAIVAAVTKRMTQTPAKPSDDVSDLFPEDDASDLV